MVTPAGKPAAEPDERSNRADDMERLLTTADQVRGLLDELGALREAALESAREEVQEIRDEAAREAQEVLAEADENARAAIEQAHAAAGEMLRAVRDEIEEVVGAASKRKSALDTAIAALDGSVHLLSSRPEGDDARDVDHHVERSRGLSRDPDGSDPTYPLFGAERDGSEES